MSFLNFFKKDDPDTYDVVTHRSSGESYANPIISGVSKTEAEKNCARKESVLGPAMRAAGITGYSVEKSKSSREE